MGLLGKVSGAVKKVASSVKKVATTVKAKVGAAGAAMRKIASKSPILAKTIAKSAPMIAKAAPMVAKAMPALRVATTAATAGTIAYKAGKKIGTAVGNKLKGLTVKKEANKMGTLKKAVIGVGAAVGGAALAYGAYKVGKRIFNSSGQVVGMTRSRRTIPKAVSKWITRTVRKQKTIMKGLRKLYSASGAKRLIAPKVIGRRK